MKLPAQYQPEQYEADIYHLWEQNEAFKPVNRGNDDYFSIDFPPPNANGDLHLGHALTVAVEDTLVRYHRMQGRATIFIPGADHAGFETQVVFEKQLNKQGKSRFDYSREELYRLIWDFVQANKHNFEAQLRALGASFDWSRFTFTLDPKVIETAYKTFQKLWHDDLIYRGNRIVNFCTFHGTSFSDIEVIHEEQDSKLWYIAYPLVDGSGEVVIATTRPETKLGQAALMVHPDDKRYKAVVGKEVYQPLVPDKPIKIIADEFVNMKFGTGVVTVTPAHDPNDFEVAGRHNLPILELITPEGKMGPNVPEPFRGLTVLQARAATEKALSDKKLLRKIDAYRHSVGKCYKCGTVIEPMLREQWFVRMQPLTEAAHKTLDSKKISFFPASKAKLLKRYLTEVKDWNISRQIAWGIPIPAFQNVADPSDWIFDTRVDQAEIVVDGKKYRRDPDVFDTWFSSGQWPYVTLDYPDGEDFKKFYPLTLMETGGEILFQWVARMIMLGLYTTGEVPFKNVYIHGYVLAEDGAKMSKSIGNVINPQDVVGAYGSDALRMGLLTGRRPGINQGFDTTKIVAGRNFANKLWNVARYVEGRLTETPSGTEVKAVSLADNWILDRAGKSAELIGQALENYRLSEAYELLYQFVWHDFADWYIEVSKIEPNLPLLQYSLEMILKLAHPFAPFVTETIWQTLDWTHGSILAVQPWPKKAAFAADQAAAFNDIIDIISQIRIVSAAVKARQPTFYYRNSELIKQSAGLIQRLGRVRAVSETAAEKDQGMRINKVGYDCWLDIDTGAAKAYLDTLIEQKAGREEAIGRLEGRLENSDYRQKAPAEIVAQTEHQLEQERSLLAQTAAEIDSFTKMINS
jgi:valyl-tRNA synthetase